ncbi:MAG: SGNH/GDSL hydrolase family protein [Myxococcales bacterium]
MARDLPLRYVAFGDSTSVGVGARSGGGYPDRLAERLRREGFAVELLNLGVSGATTGDLAGGRVRRIPGRPPDLVTLGIGGNDAWRMVPNDTFAQRLDAIATALELTGARVVVCNLPDLGHAPAAAIAQAWLGVTPAQVTSRIRELNRFVDALASRPRFTVVDIFGYSQRELPGRPELFCSDGFHPSAEGYERWAEVMWPAVLDAARRWRDEG